VFRGAKNSKYFLIAEIVKRGYNIAVETIKNIAQKFLDEENMSVTNMLSFASLGLARCVGDISEIAYGVGFSGHPYSDERKEMVAEVLGDIMFYGSILAISAGIPWQNIKDRWVAAWNVKNKSNLESRISILEMLKHMKHKDKLKKEIIEPSGQTMKPSVEMFGALLSQEEKKQQSQNKQV
jgi:uncharacterized protein YfbU (UPF0304 family)